eukprot:TRINITY_DN3474_c0_g2_i1.p1 TRINITY_DN3474_c0_g2~~TRINITY_DN3474_c0_g2_i1.p1  ORF type:complete len:652 (+),score=162.26 TRINITY_DN3474_c0_g2_i1:90-1958(+)
MANLATLICLTFLVCGQALTSPKTRFIDIPLLSEEDVDVALQAELNGTRSTERLEALEKALRSTYDALPKTTKDGELGSQTVRYVLHRFFLNQRGWLIKGLEPQANTWELQGEFSKDTAQDWKGWVPSYLQQRLESKGSVRFTELVAMAATIEDLVHKEAARQLDEVYEALGLESKKPISHSEAQDVIDMYLMVYVTSRNLSFADPVTQRKRLKVFAKKYTGFEEVHRWLGKVEAHHNMSSSNNAEVKYSTVEAVIQEMGEQYPEFNDQECLDLKKVMMDMEGGSRKAGRIPLADFYSKSKFTHWKFTESPEYLRSLGALDETDPKRPQVIVSNYVSSFNNCLRATELYSICCRSECETLMGSLEKEIARASVPPKQIAELVAKMSTSTVAARGILDEKLRGRLEEVASANDGEVQLHGRLFAQFMHHAFPRECPYPHEAGTTNPQTPDEWLKSNGQETQASEERIEQIIQESCPASGFRSPMGGGVEASPCGAEEVSELPWSNTEELLENNAASSTSASTSTWIFVAAAGVTAVVMIAGVVGALAFEQHSRLSFGANSKIVAAVLCMLALTAVCTALDLVSPWAMLAAAVVFAAWRFTTMHVNVCVPLGKEVFDKGEKSLV